MCHIGLHGTCKTVLSLSLCFCTVLKNIVKQNKTSYILAIMCAPQNIFATTIFKLSRNKKTPLTIDKMFLAVDKTWVHYYTPE